MFKPWDWKLKETGGGPDHFLLIWFEEGKESLRGVFAQNLPPGYVPEPSTKHRYCDPRTAEKLAESKVTGKSTNIWTYDILDVEDSKIAVETGFGCGTCMRALTDYIVELAKQRPIERWRVTGGGQGYDAVTVAEGEGSQSFMEYLSLSSLPNELPDFEALHAALLQLLKQAPHIEVFRLGEFIARERMCKFTLLLHTDITGEVKSSGSLRNFRGWRPYTEEANTIGRDLIERCQIPGKMGNELSDKDDLILCDDGEQVPRPIGFELVFGFWNDTDYDAPSEFL